MTMPGAPLLVINSKKVVNWWNMLHLQVYADGTSKIIFVDDTVSLTAEETKAFIAYAKNNGDSLRMDDTAAPKESKGTASDRFAELTEEGG
jgi:hypothetical protein